MYYRRRLTPSKTGKSRRVSRTMQWLVSFRTNGSSNFGSSRLGQSFHTDDGDILALYAMNTDQNGGRTCIASGWMVYNELASSRTDVLHTLTQDWVLDT